MFNNKNNNRRVLGKLVLTGSLVAALAVPMAGAASAAPSTVAPYTMAAKGLMTVYSASNLPSVNWTQLVNQNGLDLNKLIQQFQQNLANGSAGQVAAPTAPSGSSQASAGTTAGSKAGTTSATGTAHADTSTGSKVSTGTTAGSGHTSTSAGSKASTSTSHAGTSTSSKTGSGSTAATSHAGTNTGSKASSSSSSSNTGSSANSGAVATQSDFAAQVVSLVNQERAKAGLKALKSDSKLTSVASAKAKDMYTNNYFDHTSPTYGSPFDMMKQFGVSYSYAGENIAKGQQNPQSVMDAWMNSSGHRANILNANYTSIGVAYYNGEWVQEFTG